MSNLPNAPYEALASEYYITDSHPTCANFRELSEAYIVRELSKVQNVVRVLEVGAGKSIAAEYFATNGGLEKLTISDQSPSMLLHSQKWIKDGALMLIADARELPPDLPKVNLFIASLADPYNVKEFWSCAFNALIPGGTMICTLPSYEWAASFRGRGKSHLDFAEFVLTTGIVHLVPSFVPKLVKQFQMITTAGFAVKRYDSFTVDMLKDGATISPKLIGENKEMPVLWGFTAIKPT